MRDFTPFIGIRVLVASALLSLAVGVGCWHLFQLIDRLNNANHLAHQYVQAGGKLVSFRLQLEQHLNTAFYLTRGLATLIDTGLLHQNDIKQWWDANFQGWAAHTKQQMPFIRNIGYADHYRITHVYPLKGNESVLGIDYRDVPAQWPDVERMVARKQPVLAGPLDLIQGGKGLVFRTPFYTRNEAGEDVYQGLIMLALDLPGLLETAGIKTIQKELRIALRRVEDNGRPGEVFLGDERLFEQSFHSLPKLVRPVSFLGGRWLLAAEPYGGWETRSPFSNSLQILAVFATGLISLATFISLIGLVNHVRQARTLEEKVNERTRELQQANQARNTFFAAVTHELRTPLNAIIGLGQMVSRMATDAQQQEYLRKQLSSARLLLNLINDILLYAKMESGKETLHPAPFLLSQLRQQLEALLLLQAEEKGIAFRFSQPEGMHDAWLGDEEKLLQILTNLCANAIKFTEKGSVVVHWQEEPGAGQTTWLCLSVTDTGIGMTASDMEKLFEPFSQFGNQLHHHHEGTGLGLSICKRLTELMGGTIQATSQPGAGSCFSVRLPMPRAAMEQRLAQAVVSNALTVSPEEPHNLLQGKTVLLADDNAVNRLISQHLLESLGMNVIQAQDGHEVLDLLQKQPVDVVLMDMNMPGMDGAETTRAIRAMPACTGLPVIAFTAHAGNDARRASAAAGMNDFVIKPVDREPLRMALERCLLNAAPGSSPPHTH